MLGLLLAAVPAAVARAAEAALPADVVRLGDGRLVRLAGVEVPASRAGAVMGVDLAGLATEPAAPRADRWGRLRAQVKGPGRRWVQGELVRAGDAVVAPAEDVPAGVLAELLALEKEARGARRGVWATAEAGPWPAARVTAAPGSYGLVEGRVVKAARAQGFVYLNFGRRWTEDFTARAEEADARRLAKGGLDLLKLEGRDLIVRGTLFEQGGPMVELAHPAQVEVVGG